MNAETIKAQIEAALPGCSVELVVNPSPSAQHSLVVAAKDAHAVAEFLREAEGLRFDFCSNVTGVDWPAKEIVTKTKVKRLVDGVETEVEETQKTVTGDFMEAVYHLFSMELGHGPLVLRQRTQGRAVGAVVASLTPVWRSADFQEREIFDLFGVVFTGHPDLRRLLMWDEYEDHPMRRDYVDPDDYEYEPTAHDEILKRAREHAAEQEATK
jgi:NADH-quinone oxidoreductase subunit C